MSETLAEFLARVHRDDIATGKDVMHREGQCDICDEHREKEKVA